MLLGIIRAEVVATMGIAIGMVDGFVSHLRRRLSGLVESSCLMAISLVGIVLVLCLIAASHSALLVKRSLVELVPSPRHGGDALLKVPFLPGRCYALYCYDNKIAVEWSRYLPVVRGPHRDDRAAVAASHGRFPRPTGGEFLGFRFGRGPSIGTDATGHLMMGSESIAVAIPLWFPLASSLILPGRWCLGRLRARRDGCRRRAGHCIGCGYDLRASPQRCPECGRVVTPLLSSGG